MKNPSTSPVAAGWPTMGFVLACLCVAGRSRAAADGWGAGLTMATRFDDGSSRAGGEWVGSMTPQLEFTRHASQLRWDFGARRRFDATSSEAPRPAGDAVSLQVQGASPSGLDLDAGGRYYRSRDVLSQDPQGPAVADATESARGSVRLSAFRAEVHYQGRGSSHARSERPDGWSQSVAGTIFPQRTRSTTLLARGSYQEWVMDGVRSVSAVTTTVGYRRVHTPLVNSEAEVGVVSERAAGMERDPGLAWAVGVDGLARALGLPLDSRLRVGRDVATHGRAQLSRSVAGFAISAGWSRALEADGGWFPVPAMVDLGTLGVADTLGSGTVLSLEGGLGSARPRGGNQDPVESLRAEGSLWHALRPWLAGRASCSYLRRRETGGAGFHRGRAEVALTASF